MTGYRAPLADFNFLFDELVDLEAIAGLGNFDIVSRDLVRQIVEEAGRFASEVLAPLNGSGDREGVKFQDGNVEMPEGFKAAYRQFVEAGWNNVSVAEAEGGQGLPRVLSVVLEEIFMAANKAFNMCPSLTLGAIEAISKAATPELKGKYLPKLVSGEWSGTMNLTEPQAGSDVGALRCRAETQEDGTFRLFGQKIYITFGEHDLSENIVHLVLARLPDAPAGVKGISLFLVPKYLVGDDGTANTRNDVHCISVEHKLGTHASPTCVMSYGDNEGAVGYLVGEPNRGLQAMFVMMNSARLTVGMEGIALSERAYQQALEFARERVQGTSVARKGEPVAIIQHPDVKRMLLTMKSQIEAMRATALAIAQAIDFSNHHSDPAVREKNRAFADFMTPIFKGWATETGIELTGTAIQIHGGCGYIEETGVAQHVRDSYIGTIYEGTTGIQSIDLVGRKLMMDQGQAMKAVLADMRACEADLASLGDKVAKMRSGFSAAVNALEEAAASIQQQFGQNPEDAFAVSVPFLRLAGLVIGGWQMCRSLVAAWQSDTYRENKFVTSNFYCSHVLPQALALRSVVVAGAATVSEVAESDF